MPRAGCREADNAPLAAGLPFRSSPTNRCQSKDLTAAPRSAPNLRSLFDLVRSRHVQLLLDSITPPHDQAAIPVARLYHQHTRHRFEAYAAGPGSLDWDAQPAAFRRFAGAPSVSLPLIDAAFEPRPQDAPSLEGVAALLQLALGITAWKSYGPDRWAVRANPSSGNLHPVEAYVLISGIQGLGDGVYHYDPENHALSLRQSSPSLAEDGPILAIALTSAMWREAWKYGERAFRYCQLDVGHALSSLAHAAALLGWTLHEQSQVGAATLGHLLGLERKADFPGKRWDVEREEPELILTVQCRNQPTPHLIPARLRQIAEDAQWFGTATTLDRHPMYRWPLVEDVALATRRDDDPGRPPRALTVPAPLPARFLRQRRSAQRFDPNHVMSAGVFHRLCKAAGEVAAEFGIALVLYVHRIEGLAPGLYLLAAARDRAVISPHASQGFPAEGAHPDLINLARHDAVPFRRLARSLHCHQDIAATACVAMGMLMRMAEPFDRDPGTYRDMLRAAGHLGQVLYLHAESLGLRGTGIGCYFDEPVLEAAGLSDGEFRSLYHFTIGLPIEDGRIETTPAYPHPRKPSP